MSDLIWAHSIWCIHTHNDDRQSLAKDRTPCRYTQVKAGIALACYQTTGLATVPVQRTFPLRPRFSHAQPVKSDEDSQPVRVAMVRPLHLVLPINRFVDIHSKLRKLHQPTGPVLESHPFAIDQKLKVIRYMDVVAINLPRELLHQTLDCGLLRGVVFLCGLFLGLIALHFVHDDHEHVRIPKEVVTDVIKVAAEPINARLQAGHIPR